MHGTVTHILGNTLTSLQKLSVRKKGWHGKKGWKKRVPVKFTKKGPLFSKTAIFYRVKMGEMLNRQCKKG